MSSVTKLPDQNSRVGREPGTAVPRPATDGASGGGASGGSVVLRQARFTAAMISRLRRRLGLTQDGFADRYRIPRRLLQRWEAAELGPDGQALAYLRAIAREPAG